MTDKPRNIRNNNPGNIRLTSDRWRGQVLPSPDRSFAVFKSPEWGYRALFVVLEGYTSIPQAGDLLRLSGT